MGLSKSYDYVRHDLLIDKLEIYNLDKSNLYCWNILDGIL